MSTPQENQRNDKPLPPREVTQKIEIWVTRGQLSWLATTFRQAMRLQTVAECGPALLDLAMAASGAKLTAAAEPPSWWAVRQSLASGPRIEVAGRTTPTALDATEIAKATGIHPQTIRATILPAMLAAGHVYETAPLRSGTRWVKGYHLTPLGWWYWIQSLTDPVEQASTEDWIDELIERSIWPADLVTAYRRAREGVGAKEGGHP